MTLIQSPFSPQLPLEPSRLRTADSSCDLKGQMLQWIPVISHPEAQSVLGPHESPCLS